MRNNLCKVEDDSQWMSNCFVQTFNLVQIMMESFVSFVSGDDFLIEHDEQIF